MFCTHGVIPSWIRVGNRVEIWIATINIYYTNVCVVIKLKLEFYQIQLFGKDIKVNIA